MTSITSLYDIHLKINLLTSGFDIEIKLGVESLIQKIGLHCDIHLKINRLTSGVCI